MKEGHCRVEGQGGNVGQASGAGPGFPQEERGVVAEPNTFGDWKELSGCVQKKGCGRLGLLMEMKAVSVKLG